MGALDLLKESQGPSSPSKPWLSPRTCTTRKSILMTILSTGTWSSTKNWPSRYPNPPDDRDGVEESGGPAEPGLDPLHAPRAGASHPTLQETTHQRSQVTTPCFIFEDYVYYPLISPNPNHRVVMIIPQHVFLQIINY